MQGCKSDLLSNLFVNFKDEQNDFIEKGENLENYKKLDSSRILLNQLKLFYLMKKKILNLLMN